MVHGGVGDARCSEGGLEHTSANGACGYSELAREKMWSRIHLIPLLQAEEDRDLVRRTLADRAREKELLGSETKVYNSDRYVLAVSGMKLGTLYMADSWFL